MIKIDKITLHKDGEKVIENAKRLKKDWTRDEGYDLTWDEMVMLQFYGYITELTAFSDHWEWAPTDLLEAL